MTGFLVEWVAKIINNADILKLIFGIYFSFQRIVNIPILGHAKLIASSILMYGENRYLHKEFALTLYGMPMIIHSATSRIGRAINILDFFNHRPIGSFIEFHMNELIKNSVPVIHKSCFFVNFASNIG